MKTKAKLTLAISVLSAAVLAAGVTSTFAWFTTQSKATFAANMTVDSVTDIQISVTKLGFVAAAATDFATSYNDQNGALGLVSSHDGKAFWAPAALQSDQASYTTMTSLTTSTAWGANTNKHVGYMKYGINAKAEHESGAGRSLRITLKKPTVAGDNLTAVYRIAFGETDDDYATGDLTVYSHTATSHTGYTGATTKGSVFTTTAIGSANVVIDVPTVKTSDDDGINKYYVLSIWAEGSDTTNATNDIGGDTLSFGADFELV